MVECGNFAFRTHILIGRNSASECTILVCVLWANEEDGMARGVLCGEPYRCRLLFVPLFSSFPCSFPIPCAFCVHRRYRGSCRYSARNTMKECEDENLVKSVDKLWALIHEYISAVVQWNSVNFNSNLDIKGASSRPRSPEVGFQSTATHLSRPSL